MEESIYQLIPKEKVQIQKSKMYRSSLPSFIAPTGSTFGNQQTGNPGVNNVSGSYIRINNRYRSENGVLGKPQTQQLSPIKSRIMGVNSLDAWKEQGSVFRDLSQSKKMRLKPLVPKHDEKPIMGLKTSKDFIATNAIEAILSNPKQIQEETNWLHKPNFGTVPLYLSQIKEDLNKQYEFNQSLAMSQLQEENQKTQLLQDEEIEQIRYGLKQKWNAINKQYQMLTHMAKFDTIGLKRKKETYEELLTQLEKDMEKVNKKFVFVQTNK